MTSPLARRAVRHVRWRLERARRMWQILVGRGDRTVIMTPQVGPRFGNLLYLWLAASRRSAEGRPTVVMSSPAMDEWLPVFPALRELTVEPTDLRVHDRREWDATYGFQRFGVDFTRDSLASFVRAHLAAHIPADRSGRLVVNVRRGDYYAEPHLRELYGFDQVAYVAAALDRIGAVDRALVVSDDADWCREHLDPVLRPRVAEIEYMDPDPRANFLAVAGASRIVGTNSTFTYWAAYVADVVHDDAVIVMPGFHSRAPAAETAYQLDPRWTILDGF
ncbi:alpha-1,2-fucosyltransferase [Microbacterium rhizophilus]|uniref:alpha-1,2-fucosyltransferase n=1 Tax=Microbacterium rhizophilus TaxID=3138934 RepID=UPI0031F0D60A